MKEFTVTDGKQDFAFRLPTKISEITGDYLKAVTDDIVIAPYHAVIASIYRAKLPEVISTNKKSKAMAVAIVPVFVKANLNGKIEEGTAALFEELNAADRIIIAGTDIERGYQLSTPKNMITMENVIKIYNLFIMSKLEHIFLLSFFCLLYRDELTLLSLYLKL